MYHWIVDISNGNQDALFHLTNDKPRCQLGLLNEETGEETPTECILYIEQNELMIERVGNTPIVLERGSRNRTLRSSHPTRVLPQDIIHIGESVFHVERIQQDCQTRRKFSQLRQMTNKAMLAGAAAMMTVIPACKTISPPDNNQDTAGVVVPSSDGSPCENGKVMCLHNTRYECENHQWKFIEYCQTPSLCEYQSDGDVQCSKKDEAPSSPDSLTEEQRREIEMTHVEANGGDAVAQIPNANPDPSADSDAIGFACKNGKRMCLTNNRYECENHQWKLIEKCQKPALCEYSYLRASTSCTNTEPCKDGEYACFGSSIRCEQHPGFDCGRDDEMYKCKDSHWKRVKKCPEDKTCTIQDDGTAKCVEILRVMGIPKFGNECEDGEMKCESGARMFCRWGWWKYKDVCDKNEMCTIISDTDVRCEPEQSAGVKREK